jgi:riboflavin synthase
MFTGLVERVGRITAIENIDSAEGLAQKLVIEVPDAEFLGDAIIGESISVNGTCLTATELTATSFAVTAVEETLRRTTLGQRREGDTVNLERALPLSARLGGHIVQGHVDGVAIVTAARPEGEGWWITFEPPHDLMKYVVEKGSICLDGVSLTVANVAYSKFSVALIPHTREVTIAGQWEPGVQVNMEVDIIAKYVERLTAWNNQAAEPPRTLEI